VLFCRFIDVDDAAEITGAGVMMVCLLEAPSSWTALKAEHRLRGG